MKNRAVLGFVNKATHPLKYGKWAHLYGKLYFNNRLVAKRSNSEIYVYPKTIVDCGGEWNTYHAIDKVVKYLEGL